MDTRNGKSAISPSEVKKLMDASFGGAAKRKQFITELKTFKLSYQSIIDLLSIQHDKSKITLGLKIVSDGADETNHFIELLSLLLDREARLYEQIFTLILLTNNDYENIGIKIGLSYPRCLDTYFSLLEKIVDCAVTVQCQDIESTQIETTYPKLTNEMYGKLFRKIGDIHPMGYMGLILGYKAKELGILKYIAFLDKIARKNLVLATDVMNSLFVFNTYRCNLGMMIACYHQTKATQAYMKLLMSLLDLGISPANMAALLNTVGNKGQAIFSLFLTHPDSLNVFYELLSKMIEKGASVNMITEILLTRRVIWGEIDPHLYPATLYRLIYQLIDHGIQAMELNRSMSTQFSYKFLKYAKLSNQSNIQPNKADIFYKLVCLGLYKYDTDTGKNPLLLFNYLKNLSSAEQEDAIKKLSDPQHPLNWYLTNNELDKKLLESVNHFVSQPLHPTNNEKSEATSSSPVEQPILNDEVQPIYYPPLYPYYLPGIFIPLPNNNPSQSTSGSLLDEDIPRLPNPVPLLPQGFSSAHYPGLYAPVRPDTSITNEYLPTSNLNNS